MKTYKFKFFFAGIIYFVLILLTGCFEGKLTILSTNDSHSHLLGAPYELYDPMVPGDGTTGGAARVATIFASERCDNPNTLIFSAGDFIDSTIFICAEDGSGDINMLSYLGYDAACIGNHEMSMGPAGLADMINRAKKPMVPLLCANMQFSNEDTPLGHSDDSLEALHSETEQSGKYLFDYIIRVLPSGDKAAIFGLLGDDVLMPDTFPVEFPVNYLKVQNLVNKLRLVEKADVVICLMHAALSIDSGGEASGAIADLAKNVWGIDLICAGHSHIAGGTQVKYRLALCDWTTTIIEAGDELNFVAKADLDMSDTENPIITTEIIPVDDTIAGDTAIDATVDGFIADVEENYLRIYPKLSDGGIFSVLSSSEFSLSRLNSMNLVTDTMRAASGSNVALCTKGGDTAMVNVNSFGEITVYDAFKAIPHSMGRDGKHGGALYKFYFKASELLTVFELGTAFLGQLTGDMFVLPSGLKVIFDTNRLIGRRVLKIYAVSPDEVSETLIFDRTDPKYLFSGGWIADPDELYTVSTSYLTLTGLKFISETLLIVQVWPRDSSGAQVKWQIADELDLFVVNRVNPENSEMYEIKAWYSLSAWLDDLPGKMIPMRFDDTEAPAGPPWRRVWDINTYGEP